MSHGVRTSMNGILGMTHLAMETDDADRRQRFDHAGQQSAEGLLGLLNDILDFSKMEAGQFELHPAPFALAPLLESVGSAPSVQAPNVVSSWRWDIDPALPARILGDGSLSYLQFCRQEGPNDTKEPSSGDL